MVRLVVQKAASKSALLTLVDTKPTLVPLAPSTSPGVKMMGERVFVSPHDALSEYLGIAPQRWIEVVACRVDRSEGSAKIPLAA